MFQDRLLLPLAAAYLSLAAVGCTGGAIAIKSLNVETLKADQLSIAAELDTSLLSAEYARHSFGFNYIVLAQSNFPPSVPSNVATITPAQLDALEKAMTEALCDDTQARYPGEFWSHPGEERIKDRIASGIGVMRMIGGTNAPPYRYAIVLPLLPPPDRPDLAYTFKRPGRYAIAMRIVGAVPKFGYPFISSQRVNSNVRVLVVDFRE